MYMKNLALLSSVAALAVLSATSGYAQVIPGSASPDIRSRQLQIQEKAPKVSGQPVISSDEGQSAKEIKGGLSFTLKSITIENSTVFKDGELESIYKDKIGTKISVSQLNKITSDITSYYRNKGYILTRAVLPPQQINGGNVKIRIVEGFINSVKIQGDDAANDELIKAYGERIRAEKPLNVETLERYLLLMEDLPGVEARAVLQPAPNTQGASDIIVNIKRKPIEGSATFDNRGSRFLGPEQLGLTAAFNNVIGVNDQTQFRIVNTPFGFHELQFGEVRHEEQLGTDGTKGILSASYVQTEPQFNLKPFEIVGKSNAYSAGISHPLLRSRRENWFVNGDFTFRNSELDTLGSDLSYDKTRVFAIATSYDVVDSTSAINRAELRYARGVDIGTKVRTQPHSRANGQPVFDKFTSKLSRIQPIDGPWSVTASAAGQWSPDTLYASEEFAIGGAEFGSAYDSAELTGDSGAAGRIELQYNEAPQLSYLSQYQVYGFYDIGRVWNRLPITGSEASTADLSSTGLGVRFNVSEQISGGFEGALPLTKKVSAFGADGGDPRVFFNLQYRY
jgi:hemolysin activation/secretion protein